MQRLLTPSPKAYARYTPASSKRKTIHIALLGLKKRFKKDYRDFIELIAEMPKIIEVLKLRAYSVRYKYTNAHITHMKFMKVAAGIFGGEDIIIQKLKGPGTVFINIFSDIIEYDLSKNQTLKVMNSHIVGFKSTIAFDVRYIGDIKTTVFGAVMGLCSQS